MCLRSKHGWTALRHILRLLKHTQCSIWWVQRIGGTKASIYILIGVVLIRGKSGEGEEEKNYWDACVAVGGLYEMEALFDLEGNCWTCSGSN
jgi:hypothetical protein